MATTVTVYDIDNYPDNGKSVIVDLKQVVTIGTLGDDRWCISGSTSATASGSASIQDIYIVDYTLGWCMSSDFEQGPYTINSSQNAMQVSINGSTYRTITLTNQASPVSGDAVAADMQTKIRALAATGAAEEGNLAFKNAWVTFDSGRFIIQSGASADGYTGTDKTSVSVAAAASNDVSAHLGFFAAVTSEDIAGASVDETYLQYAYVTSSGYGYIEVADSSIASAGECIGITDGSNTEYRYVSSVSTGRIYVNSDFSNDYAAESRVQVLRMQDPRSNPYPTLDSVDEAVRYVIASLANQIDFSS